MSADPATSISPDIRAAISNFLHASQGETGPVAVSSAIDAIRRVFPELDVSDAELADATVSEAMTAGREIEFDVLKSADAFERHSRPEDGAPSPSIPAPGEAGIIATNEM